MSFWKKLFHRNRVTPEVENECYNLMQEWAHESESTKKRGLHARTSELSKKYNLSNEDRGNLASKVWHRISGKEFILELPSNTPFEEIAQKALYHKTVTKTAFSEIYALLCAAEKVIVKELPKIRTNPFGYAQRGVSVDCGKCGLRFSHEAASALMMSSPVLQNVFSNALVMGRNARTATGGACPNCGNNIALVTLELRSDKVRTIGAE